MGEYIRSNEAGNVISGIAKRQFNRRRSDYEAMSLLDWEDLSQEIWFRLLEREPEVTPDTLLSRALYQSEAIAFHGRKRRRAGKKLDMTVVPRNRLGEIDRIVFDRVAYAADGEDLE